MTGYAIKHEGAAFSPDGRMTPKMTDAEVAQHNKAIEAVELATWAKCPDHHAVYVTDHSTVTTWLGTKLGTIQRRNTFSTNLSRNMVALTIRGTNGATYHGRYGADWSQLCRIRKAKG